ncbi:MAG TPA: hypothetical protein VMV69_08490 [Pirellulales bacterium]|nr:hypothetical protein [Pirellulales bacterium]
MPSGDNISLSIARSLHRPKGPGQGDRSNVLAIFKAPDDGGADDVTTCSYGFRVVGPTWQARRLVNAAAALAVCVVRY